MPHHRYLAALGVLGLVGSGGLAAVPAAAADLELPVYRVLESGVDGQRAAGLGKAFGLADVAAAEDGAVRWADEKAFLAVPTRKAGRTGRDEDGNRTVAEVLDTDALAKLRPIDAETALARTEEALSGLGLYPGEAKPEVGHTSLEMVDDSGERTASAHLDTTVSFTFSLAGLPYEGPGAKIRVGYGTDGAVTQLSYSARRLEQAGTVAVLDAAAAVDRCTEATAGAVKITEASYTYWAPALSTRLDTIEPGIRCAGVNDDGTAAQIVVVPAAVDAKLPELPGPPPPRGERKGTVQGPSAKLFGRVDVGSEGTGPCSGLPWTGSNLASFNNRFTASGVPVSFSWLDQNAWEDDFKDPAFNGHDSDWTDLVDMTYWQGHGAPTGFSFSGCSSTDDTFLSNTDARWGNGDVEWMSLFTCLILKADDGGQRWWQRWGDAFHGLHQINSFDTVSYHSASHGGTYANYLLRNPFLGWNKPMTVRGAWAQASIDDQPASVVWATMGPVGPGGLVNFNDYFWGKGSVGPDVPRSAVTGWWYITGNS
jgi:hypothetical protein